MRSKAFFLAFTAPSLAFGAILNRQSHIVPSSGISPSSSTFGINLFNGNASGPCSDPSIEVALNDAYVLNSTANYCFSTHSNPTTCIGRRMREPPGIETPNQRYEAAHGGLDTKTYQCTVFGYQQDGCPRDTGTEAQYHKDNATWSWDHETRVRDDFPGRLWSVLSFQMSCKL